MLKCLYPQRSPNYFNQIELVLRILALFSALILLSSGISSCHSDSGRQFTEPLSVSYLDQLQITLEHQGNDNHYYLSVSRGADVLSSGLTSRFHISARALNSIPRWMPPITSNLGREGQLSLFFVYDGLSNDGKVSVLEWKYSEADSVQKLELGRTFIVPFFHLVETSLTISNDKLLILNSSGTKTNPSDRVILQYDISMNATNLNPVKIRTRRD
jgi:hypothetical protein